MKKLIITLLAALPALLASAWGQKGHDVTAYIAERHLTPVTRAAVDSIFDGRSLVYWANWLDNASHQPDLRYTKTWHYRNVDEGVRYEEAPADPAGDAVTALKSRIEILSDSTSTDADRELALKILVHVMGDLHMPLHMGHATDLGGNRIKVKFFDRDTNLHSVWDSSLPDAGHKWSYTEWQNQIDRLSDDEATLIESGTPKEWFMETAELCKGIYEATPEGTNVSYDYIDRFTTLIEQQFVKGGHRLAKLLNEIYE